MWLEYKPERKQRSKPLTGVPGRYSNAEVGWGEQRTDAAKDSEWTTYPAWLAAYSVDSIPLLATGPPGSM